MTLRIIDIETTGTDPATDAIIEIASVDLRADLAPGPSRMLQRRAFAAASRTPRRPPQHVARRVCSP